MNTYLLVVLVMQSGESPEDAKATLSMNLAEVLPPDDFEVMGVTVQVPELSKLQIITKEAHS